MIKYDEMLSRGKKCPKITVTKPIFDLYTLSFLPDNMPQSVLQCVRDDLHLRLNNVVLGRYAVKRQKRSKNKNG